MKEKIISLTEEELLKMIVEKAKSFMKEFQPSMLKEAADRLNEMPSYRTAMNARNKAINDMGDKLRYGGDNPENQELVTKRLNQANKFDNYGFEKLQSMIGTKVQAIVNVGGKYSTEIKFYIGKITDIKRLSTNEYEIFFQGVNEHDNGDILSNSFTINPQEMYRNFNRIEGIMPNGDLIQINLSNKKARQNISTLLNKNGSDEFLKPIR